MKMHCATFFLALVGTIQALNLADVPCGNLGSDSRRYFQRVMGGAVAEISDFPYTVSIKKHGQHYCGGSLINKDFVLTAAHCVKGYAVGIWSITVGEQHRGVTESHEQTIAAEDITIHKDFEISKNMNDIALIKLSSSVQWSQHVQPICLPDSEAENFAGKHGLLAGWGFDMERDDGGKLTDELHFAKLPIIDNSECQAKYNKYNEETKKTIKIIDQQICAGHAEGKIDGCQGDSGGALVSEHDQRMVMVGVMSGGIGCGRANIPGVYTSVTSYLGWINETISRWNEPSSRSSRQHWTGLDTQHRLSLLKRDVEQQLRRFPGLSQIRQSS